MSVYQKATRKLLSKTVRVHTKQTGFNAHESLGRFKFPTRSSAKAFHKDVNLTHRSTHTGRDSKLL